MVNYGLEDKVAIITGANNPQGIGATTALAFAREGAKVVLVYKRILRPFDKEKADYLVLESDISNEKSVKEIYSAVLARFGRVDILVNNAAQVFAGQITYGASKATLEKAVLPLIPMGELIQPEDIANAILFLSSEQAGMLTGQVIKVSGGHAL